VDFPLVQAFLFCRSSQRDHDALTVESLACFSIFISFILFVRFILSLTHYFPTHAVGCVAPFAQILRIKNAHDMSRSPVKKAGRKRN
jgi:hypothetical protein